MGVSSDGLLVYGIDLGEEKPEFLDDYEDMDELLLAEGNQPQWGEDGHDFDKQRAFLATCPADLTLYCSYDYPMYILSVRDTNTTVNRGYVEEIENLSVDENKRVQFVAWCEAHGIENPQPKWLLASMYG